MAFFDMPIERLRDYRPDVRTPADFEEFWRATLATELARPLDAQVERIETPLRTLDVYDVSWTGYGGQRIKGWLRVPVGLTEPIPAVVQYRGYSGGRGYPHTEALYASAGYAHFVIDARGQGWKTPSMTDPTPDTDPAAGEVHWPGLMTSGIMSRESYYYRRLHVDALRLLEVAVADERVDPARVAICGGSQGGGMTIAVAGLAGMAGIPVAAAMPDVAFLCHFERAVGLTDAYPYKEIADLLGSWPERAPQVFDTLSYVDGVTFARYATCPALFSVALMDQVCPPSTVFAAYNAWGSEAKEIAVYPWNGHEGGTDHHAWRRLEWLQEQGF
jgi:cephalosporin-C deacetylase